MNEPRIASWNSRAKYYVITEPGKKGIQARTNVGEPPPEDCILKGCTGEEWKKQYEFHIEAPEPEEVKKNEPLPESDTSLKPKQNEVPKTESSKTDWFSSIFGG